MTKLKECIRIGTLYLKICLNLGGVDALQWDFEVMEDPINYPTHNHLHHLSAWAQEKWANDIALPRIKRY